LPSHRQQPFPLLIVEKRGDTCMHVGRGEKEDIHKSYKGLRRTRTHNKEKGEGAESEERGETRREKKIKINKK
jgi:hypothetical protein